MPPVGGYQTHPVSGYQQDPRSQVLASGFDSTSGGSYQHPTQGAHQPALPAGSLGYPPDLGREHHLDPRGGSQSDPRGEYVMQSGLSSSPQFTRTPQERLPAGWYKYTCTVSGDDRYYYAAPSGEVTVNPPDIVESPTAPAPRPLGPTRRSKRKTCEYCRVSKSKVDCHLYFFASG
jgi:hypothetical protein